MASSPAPTNMAVSSAPTSVTFHQTNPTMTGMIPQSSSPHLTSSPASIQIGSSQPNMTNQIQFTQNTSMQEVMPQSPTVLQAMPQGAIQFSSPMSVLQGGQLPNSYMQPVYQGTQQMLLSSAGGLTIQQAGPMNQNNAGIQVKQGNAQQKMISVMDGQNKHVMTSVCSTNKSLPQVVTTQAISGGKIQLTTSQHQKAQQGQMMAGQNQILTTQQNANGQTLVISHPLLQQGGQIQTHQLIQSPQQMNAKNAQGKYMANQKGPQSIHISSVPAQNQYRHINPGGQQQIINAAGQQVMGQTQILQPLQAFNAFGGGLSWAGQLQGSPILQSPILIRNQHDGSMYIQSAPGTQQQQQQTQQMQQQLQNNPQLGQQVPTIQQTIQGVIPGMIHNVGPGSIVGAQTVGQAGAPTIQIPNQANQGPNQPGQQQQSVLGGTPITIQSNGQVLLGHQTIQAQTPHDQQRLTQTVRAENPESAQTTPKIANPPVTVEVVNVQNPGEQIAVQKDINAPLRIDTTPQETQEQKPQVNQPTTLQTTLEPRLPQVVAANAATVVIAPHVQPELPTVTVVSLPDAPEQELSASPAIGETFPQDAEEEPKIDEATEILTHIIHGYVIHEGPKPFPVGRKALLTDSLREEHDKLFGSRDKTPDLVADCPAVVEPPAAAAAETANPPPKPNAPSEPCTTEKPATPALPTDSSASAALSNPSSFSSLHPSQWNVQQVYDFVSSVPGCSQYADEFLSQEIDGEALLFLKRENLMSRIKIKLGPAAKICVRLGQLETEAPK